MAINWKRQPSARINPVTGNARPEYVGTVPAGSPIAWFKIASYGKSFGLFWAGMPLADMERRIYPSLGVALLEAEEVLAQAMGARGGTAVVPARDEPQTDAARLEGEAQVYGPSFQREANRSFVRVARDFAIRRFQAGEDMSNEVLHTAAQSVAYGLSTCLTVDRHAAFREEARRIWRGLQAARDGAEVFGPLQDGPDPVREMGHNHTDIARIGVFVKEDGRWWLLTARSCFLKDVVEAMREVAAFHRKAMGAGAVLHIIYPREPEPAQEDDPMGLRPYQRQALKLLRAEFGA